MMDTVRQIRLKAKTKQKVIALPEYEDSRTQEAVEIIEQEGLAKILLLTPDKVDHRQKERYIQEFYNLRKAHGTELEKVRQLFEDPLYYAAMMAREGSVDGFVAGAVHTTADMARAAIHCLGVNDRLGVACSCFIMVVPGCRYGENGTFIFADCGIIPDPTPQQLAAIAVVASDLGKKVLEITPRVAFLSYSSKGSAGGRAVKKVNDAIEIARGMAPGLLIDGELQVDAAIVPEVAQIKCGESPVAGKANVLIFPNLEAGNISYKLVERLAKARALGPLLVGLNKPCSDLSRGCSSEDIVDCVAVTAIRAQ